MNHKALILVVLFVLALIILEGCRTKTAWKQTVSKDTKNKVESTTLEYSSDTGWTVWSEGPGKTINISPSVSGVQF